MSGMCCVLISVGSVMCRAHIGAIHRGFRLYVRRTYASVIRREPRQ